jgi:signal transduction histidine kinase
MSKIFRAICLILLLPILLKASPKSEIDSLENLLSKSTHSEKLDLALSLSKAYWSISPAKGLNMALCAKELAKQSGEDKKRAKAFLYGGVNLWAMGEYDKAINYYDSCYRIAERINDEKLSAFAINNMGMIFQETGDSVKAMANFKRALVIVSGFGDKVESAKIIDNIGKLNAGSQKFDEALKSFEKAIDLIKNTAEKKLLLWVLNDIGEVYAQMKQADKAIRYFEQGLKVANEIDDKAGKSMIYNNIGLANLDRKEFANAQVSFYTALDLARESKARELQKKILKNLSDLYSQKGDYKQALDYFQVLKKINDSICDESKTKHILNLQIRYETEAKQTEIELLRKDVERTRLKIDKQNSVRNYLILSLLIALVAGIVVFGQLQLKKKANRLLEEKNKIIEKQKVDLSDMMENLKANNQTLEDQQKQIQHHVEALKEANRTKDRFFTIISHDLKSPFNGILGLSQLLIEEIQQKNYTGVEEYAGLIHQSSQQTLNLLTNLLEWARSQTGKISFRPETIQVEEMVRDIERLLANTSSRKSITVERFIPDQLQIFADNTMIELIFRNLISNAIKFTNPQGRIEIRATEETDKIVFSVADNGIGMSTATIQKLFRIDETYSTTGTQNEYGTGLGLILCKEFVDQHRGIIWVESEEGKGSTFYFSIPRT